VSWTDDLLTGVAAWLADLGVGTWAPDDPVEGQTRPFIDGALPEAPDVAAGLTAYSAVDDPAMADTLQPIQFMLRGTQDPKIVREFGDDIYDVLHGATGLVLGGVHVPLVYRQSCPPMGIDSSGRLLVAHNYYFEAMRPTASRPD
jgi:hypothetical protein